MEIKDAEKWKEYTQGVEDGEYRAYILTYAETWANLMEEQFRAGKTLAECAEDTSYLADKDDELTGGMFNFAVKILSECWVHGEELLRWHNAGMTTEADGVL
ncbi:MAG TPA: hypothetical protein VLH56_08625 [Dissulfurispiraceae bacterium]|nr:hypothetical protein [Dissulfurispiraceae bacterium]